MVQIAIIADTHVPSRADEIPGWVLEAVADADHTIHAGDFESIEALETVREHATEMTAITGNMDSGLGLPETATVKFGGAEFVVTHGTGDIEDYEERVAEIVHEEGDSDAVGVSGHTHQVLDTEIGGVRLLNPGSATGADPASTTSMMIVEVKDGELDVTVCEE